MKSVWRETYVVRALSVIVAADIAFVAGHGDLRLQLIMAQVGPIVALLVTALLYWQVGNHSSRWAGSRRFWRLLAVAVVVSAVGSVIDIVGTLIEPQPWPHGRIGVSITAPITGALGMWALLAFPMRFKRRRDRLKLLLDVLTVTAAAATFLWYFTVSKEFTGDVDGVMVLSSLITPLLMIVCVFAMTRIVIGGERVLDRKAFTMFATANALITPVTALQPVFEKELAGLTGIIAGPLLFLFVVSAHWQKNALLSPDAEKERARRPYSLLPYLAIGATLFLLLLSGGGSLQDQGVVIGSVCITLLVVVRQLAAFHENANLLRQVDVNLEELQAAYQREIAAQVQREELESELRHAQKLEAVGRLAAGIAHEINTPLQFISDNLRFIEEGVKWTTDVFAESREHYLAAGTVDIEDLDYYSEDLPRAVADGLEGAHRVSRIVHAMKAFSHVGRAELGAADINEAIRNTVIVAGSELRDIASVRTELGEIPLVQCRLGEINQVFLNLIVNAAHAVSEIRTIDTGLIVIRTSLVGDYVKIEVEDNGCGIPEDAQGHIFEPFFTTKEVGRGTGQGLSLARSEIKRHGGDIQFVTNPGRGTTFIITLPLIASEAAADGSRSAVTRFAYKDEETHLIGKH